MPLTLELKPGERLILGNCLLTNSDVRARFMIEGNVPLLREKDILPPDRADTPAKKIYLAIQLIYTSPEPSTHHDVYFALTHEFLRAAPSARGYIDVINSHIMDGNLYKALKEAKKLILYERELVHQAKAGVDIEAQAQQIRL